MPALELFSPPVAEWFRSSFAATTPAQEQGWPAIAAGGHVLIHAPTGSGKTLAAFLWGIDRLFAAPPPPERRRCRLLYISPLKALAYDIERNLRAPLQGIARWAERSGTPLPSLVTAMRTGDTPAEQRRAMLRHPPDILIITPESLYLVLTSSAREILAPVRWVIVDEVHALAGTKRGAHLALTLERLEAVTAAPPQRIGLSATQRPLEAIARFLGGGTLDGDDWTPRPVTVVDAPRDKSLEIEIVVPVEDMTRPEDDLPAPDPAAPPPRRSIWPAMYPQLLDLVRAHRSTIIFCNSRSLAERLAAQINHLAGEELAKAHHGSVSREQRLAIEDGLKTGTLRAVAATSSLELGIDMAAVDLVVLVESPPTVAHGLQRVGRAGHQVGQPSRAKVFPKHRHDLLEAAVLVHRMEQGLIEETRLPANPLDVLAQQIVAVVAGGPQRVDDLYALVRRAAPYATLRRAPFEAVLDMLAGRYPSDEFAELRPRLVWDREDGTLTPLGNARLLAVTNPGTIPDRGLYTVVVPEGGRVGELDEEMVFESRVGDTFVLGSSTWQITEITVDRVVVAPAPGSAAPRLPFWKGDTPGRPLETGRALGEFTAAVGALDPAEAQRVLIAEYHLDRRAAANLAQYLAEEKAATGALPTHRTVVVERFRDEIGDWRLVLLSPFGAGIHAPWALAASRRLRARHGLHVDAVWSDDGFILRFPDVDDPPDPAELVLAPDEVEDLVLEEAGDSALFGAAFREAAARALLLPRRRPGQRTPLWLQRRRAWGLLAAARRFPDFPIVIEAYREVLQQHFDLPALQELLGDIASRRVRLVPVTTGGPSPFASSLGLDFVASFMYEYDAPPAERRAAALTIDQGLLRDLLGEPELRELLDPEALTGVELELQHLAPGHRAVGADGMADLLRRLGPLTEAEAAARCAEGEATALLRTLAEQHRAFALALGGETRWAAVEDAARLRDALGASLPAGVPATFLVPVTDALGDVVGRFARTHGPFTEAAAAVALGLPVAAVADTLVRLEERGRVTRGAFLPGGAGREWVEIEVLRRLRRRSVARLRRQVEAVDGAAYARFLAGWHGIGERADSPEALLEAVRRLQGAAVPASILEDEVLAGRLDYRPTLLDTAAAAGEVVWVGRGALGPNDGRVALYLRPQAAALHWPLEILTPDEESHRRLRAHLEQRGASFFSDLYAAAGGGDPEQVLDALWDLVWAGEVTNDTPAPLRARLAGRYPRHSPGRRRLPAATPPAASGRWYLVADLLASPSPPTVAAASLAEQLLARHGLLGRDAVLAEGVPGGFAGLYPVLAALEEAGRARRGYFVEGLGGAQFALAGALDRLRAGEAAGVLTLAAADPAHPYGASLPWPEHPAGRPSRSAGAYLVLVDGRPGAFVERGGRRLLTFTTDGAELAEIARALAALARRRRRLRPAVVDGLPAEDTALGRALTGAGFVPSYRGIVLRPA
ncbi:MAG: DEAD/DEAH box helicase [Acidimicrobiia bacterium]|nr:DEAD/DEAH box helicase [Acidimicrobiia bacterium]